MTPSLTVCSQPVSMDGVRFLISQPQLFYPCFDNDEMVVAENFIVEFKFDGRLYRVQLAPGFKFDGASIPKWAWSIVGSPYTGKYRLATLVHDAFYKIKHGPRKLADDIMLHLMKSSGVGSIKANTIYRSVRVGGSSAWKQKRKKEQADLVSIFSVETE